MNKNVKMALSKHTILNTFKYYKQGSSVPSDGNCGLHAICRALVEGVLMINKTKPDSLMVNIFCMFDLQSLPNYWWSDEELAVIANYFGYDMYIYNEADKTGIVFGKGIRPPLVLYSVDNNSHWIPGKKTKVPSSCIPTNFTVIENISEVLSIKQIKIKIKGHLLMQSLNFNGEYNVKNYSGRRNRSRSVSSGRRVTSNSSKRYNGSRSRVLNDGRNLNGRNNVNCNKRRDQSRRGGCDGVRIARRDGSHPRLGEGCVGGKKESHGAEKKKSHSEEEKENYNRKEEENHNKIEKESLSGKSYESLMVLYTTPINGNHSCGTVKQNLRLYVKLTFAMLSKMIKQLYHWTGNKEKKYKKLVLVDSEDQPDDFKDAELNNSKNKRELLIVEGSEASVPPQSLELSVVQFEADEYPQLDFVEVECPPMVDIDCYCNRTDDYSLCTSVDYCSNVDVDYCTNPAINHPFIMSDCPFKSTDSPCDVADCPFTSSNYICEDQWINNDYDDYDDYVTDLSDGYTLIRNKNMGDRLFGRVYNQTVKMSKKVIARCFFKRKLTAKTSSAVGSVLVAPAIAASAVWTVGAPELGSPVMQMTSEVVAPTTGASDVAAPTMVTPQKAVLMKNDPDVKPKASIKRYFSLKKIWRKKK